MVLSELLLMVMLWFVVRAGGCQRNARHNTSSKLPSLGVFGRAYVVFSVVVVATGSMAWGCWWALGCWFEMPLILGGLFATRFALWIGSTAVVCALLEQAGELPEGTTSSSFESTSSGGGIWAHVLGWTVAEPCASFGRVLMEPSPFSSLWKCKVRTNTDADNNTHLEAHPKGSGTMVSGRSASNVAGKSRLVDRGASGARSVV